MLIYSHCFGLLGNADEGRDGSGIAGGVIGALTVIIIALVLICVLVFITSKKHNKETKKVCYAIFVATLATMSVSIV